MLNDIIIIVDYYVVLVILLCSLVACLHAAVQSTDEAVNGGFRHVHHVSLYRGPTKKDPPKGLIVSCYSATAVALIEWKIIFFFIIIVLF